MARDAGRHNTYGPAAGRPPGTRVVARHRPASRQAQELSRELWPGTDRQVARHKSFGPSGRPARELWEFL